MSGRPPLALPVQELMSEASLYPHGPSYMYAPPQRLWLSLEEGNWTGEKEYHYYQHGHHECTRTEAVSEYGRPEKSRQEKSGGTEAVCEYGRQARSRQKRSGGTEAVSEYGRKERSDGQLASRPLRASFIFFFFITLGLEMSDTKVFEP